MQEKSQMWIGHWYELRELASASVTGGIVGSETAKAELFAFPVLSSKSFFSKHNSSNQEQVVFLLMEVQSTEIFMHYY